MCLIKGQVGSRVCIIRGQGRSRVCLITGHIERYGVFK